MGICNISPELEICILKQVYDVQFAPYAHTYSRKDQFTKFDNDMLQFSTRLEKCSIIRRKVMNLKYYILFELICILLDV
jgi:hypothetical protein